MFPQCQRPALEGQGGGRASTRGGHEGMHVEAGWPGRRESVTQRLDLSGFFRETEPTRICLYIYFICLYFLFV